MLTVPTTIVSEEDQDITAPATTRAMALVVCWCRDEPWRIGEVLLIPPDGASPATWFGRGLAAVGEPVKAPLGQLRPSGWLPSPPLGGRSISRYQLELRAASGARLLVRNAGKCPLLVNDRRMDSGQLDPGDMVQLGRHMLFRCVQREVNGPAVGARTDFDFGQPDANGIVGESPAIWELRRQIARLAPLNGHVLVTGASGSGKELVAQAIHALSARRGRPLVARNAATLPETLIDAELFGNARNYPNPGMPERAGLIGDADHSTLFLDELAELPHSAQAHLLRVLDAGEYQRLGESRARRSNFRVVAATNRDPGALKHDLLARFDFRIAVPPLERHKEDVPLLVQHLLHTTPDFRSLAGLGRAGAADEPSLDVMRRLLAHRYTTGVRELRGLLWKALTMSEDAGDEAAIEPFDRAPQPPHLRSAPPPAPTGLPSAEDVQECLDQHNGVIELAWRTLGLNNRFVLLRLIKRYDIEVRRRPSRGRLRSDAGN
jgi:two-component system nitrogen regulation response regulator GlnG/two-component system response regulator HydG